MKNIFLLVFTLIVTLSAKAEIGPVNRSNNLKYDGTVDVFEKRYINVKNGGSAITAGSVVVLDLTADDGATIGTTTTDTSSPLCVVVAACAASALCKCQTYGYFASVLFDATNSAAVAGKRAYLSTNNAGYVAARGTELATDKAIGIFYDSGSASGAVEIFIDK